jgi:hypothetical protein
MKFALRNMFALALMVAFASAVYAQEAEEKPEDPGKAELTLNGKKVTVTFGRPSTDGPGYKRMEQGVPDDFVWRMGSNDPTQLETETALKFGDKTVPAGTYGLWAKRRGDGWDLVVSKAVVLPNAPEAKESVLHVIPLDHKRIEKPVKYMLIELLPLEGDKNAGAFRLAWGPEEGTAKFTAAE